MITTCIQLTQHPVWESGRCGGIGRGFSPLFFAPAEVSNLRLEENTINSTISLLLFSEQNGTIFL